MKINTALTKQNPKKLSGAKAERLSRRKVICHFVSRIYYGMLQQIRRLKENVFQHKDHCKNIHQCADILFLCFAGNQVDHNVGDHAHSDTFGNAV